MESHRSFRQPSFIKVTGTGLVNIPQDTAYVSFAFSDTQKMASDALDNITAASSALLQHLQDARGLKSTDFSTSGFSVQPAYTYDSNNKASLAGYTVSSSYIATVCKLDTVSSVIDDIVRVGGSLASVSSVSFGVLNVKDAEDQARKLAVDDAQAKAEMMLSEAGGRLGRLVHMDAVDAQQSYSRVYDPRSGGAARSAPVPIMAGENTVSASITATYFVHIEDCDEQQGQQTE